MSEASGNAEAFLERGREVHASAAERRSEAEEDSGDERNSDGEEKNAGIEASGEGKRPRLVARDERKNRVRSPIRESNAEDASHGGEDDAFGEELAHDARAARSEGEAKSHLLLTSSGASEHEAGDIGAGNKQDDADGAHQDIEGIGEACPRADEPGLRVDESDLGIISGLGKRSCGSLSRGRRGRRLRCVCA